MLNNEINYIEVLKSMHKMGANIDAEKDRMLFKKLDRFSLALMHSRDDMEYITVNHCDLIINPRKEMVKVRHFLDEPFAVDAAVKAVDTSLYRNRLRSVDLDM